MEITQIPDQPREPGAIYMAGSFNSWNPQDEKHKFRKDEKGNYFLELKLNNGSYEYKITRGGWDKVECRKDGKAISNRSMKTETDTTVKIIY